MQAEPEGEDEQVRAEPESPGEGGQEAEGAEEEHERGQEEQVQGGQEAESESMWEDAEEERAEMDRLAGKPAHL